MDKGLKILQELKLKLEQLRLEESKNDEELNVLKEKHCNVNNSIEDLKKSVEDLDASKKEAEEAPKEYKKERKQLIQMLVIVTLLGYVVCSAFFGINTIVGNLGFDYFKELLKIVLFAEPLLAVTLGAIFIPVLKDKYKTGDLTQITKDMQEETEELELQKSKQKGISEKITELEAIRTSLLQEINEIENKINCITNVRAKVIDEFCKYNRTLDKLLDYAYDTEIENNQQKVKTNSNN